MSSLTRKNLLRISVAGACLGLLTHFSVPIFHECDVVSYWHTGHKSETSANHGHHQSHEKHPRARHAHAEHGHTKHGHAAHGHAAHGKKHTAHDRKHNHEDCALCHSFIQLTLLADFAVTHSISVLFQLEQAYDFHIVTCLPSGCFQAATPVRGPPVI